MGRIPGTDVIAPRPAGRGSRFSEPAESEFAVVCDELVRTLEPFLDTEIALFGHSLGGLFAFEVGRGLAALGQPPALVIVAGCAAPGVISSAPRTRDLSGTALRAELVESGVVPRPVLENEALMGLALRALRADFEVQASYRMDSVAQPLDRPVRLYYGTDDVAEPERLRRTWAEVVSGPLDVAGFPGGHFFVNTAREAVLAAISSDIDRTMGLP